ncbi:uncharacterized protein [Asterias amurensis]|uniref:uncharacterized protein n=1 Tax=Asterias amurensis TaxID=7602 RepID=UPI003AB301B6
MGSVTLLLAVIALLGLVQGSLGAGYVQGSGKGIAIGYNNEVTYSFHAVASENDAEDIWKISAYANTEDVSIDNPQAKLIKTASSKDIDFKGTTVLAGFGGCPDEKNYACIYVTRGEDVVSNHCFANKAPNCKNGGGGELEEKPQSTGKASWGFATTPTFVSGSKTNINVQFRFEAAYRPGAYSGQWKMSVYGSATDSPGREDLIARYNVLSFADRDQGDEVVFTPSFILRRMNGCSGDNYACLIVYRGGKKLADGCLKFTPPCPGPVPY